VRARARAIEVDGHTEGCEKKGRLARRMRRPGLVGVVLLESEVALVHWFSWTALVWRHAYLLASSNLRPSLAAPPSASRCCIFAVTGHRNGGEWQSICHPGPQPVCDSDDPTRR
jgi:hypothetical protein